MTVPEFKLDRRPRWLLGAGLLVLVALLPLTAEATVSGNEGKITFVSDRDGDREIFVMNHDGSNQVNLTNNDLNDTNPEWSPDGTRIVFVSEAATGIWIMDRDGSNRRFVAEGFSPTWSPDGKWIAFIRSAGSENSSVWIIRTNGTDLERLSRPELDQVCVDDPSSRACKEASDAGATWTSDGSTIFFTRFKAGSASFSNRTIHRVDVRSRVETELGIQIGDLGGGLDISPDNQTLVLTNGSAASHTGQVIAKDVSSGGSRVIGNTILSAEASWSPTGERIVRTHRDDDLNTNIAIQELDGSLQILTAGSEGADTSPSLQPVNPYPMGLVDTDTGVWYFRDKTGSVSSFYYGNPGDYPFLGDWDCDGVETPGLYRQSDGFVYLRNSNTQGFANVRFFFGNPGDIPIPGDYNGDGCDTVSLYRPSTQTFYIINALGSNDAGLGKADYEFLFGDSGDKPFVGDFDGDGIDEVALHRESTGRVYMRFTLTTGIADLDFIFGDPGDRIVAGDWNNNGQESPAAFRPTNTTNYFRFNNTPGFADAQYIWGEPSWTPVHGHPDP